MDVSEFEWQGNFDDLDLEVNSENDLVILDLEEVEDEMPGSVTTLGRPSQRRDTGSASSRRTNSATSDRLKRTPRKTPRSRQNRQKGGATQGPHSDTEDDQPDAEDSDPEEKLCSHLQLCLAECSRQRLRALQMSLRHYGNVDNRVSYKDMQTSLQENQIKLSQRAVQMMTDLYQDTKGIDYIMLYSCMDRAHLKTGRDSVKARHKRNDLETKQALSIDEIDNDFLRRLEELVVKEETCFDIDQLRTEFSKWDHHRLGKMDKEGATLICSDKTPLYGALMKNLLNRCDEDKDNKISWPLLLNFMERAQTHAFEKHPELPELVEKKKESKSSRIVTPEPLDELSSSTRSKVMSKLLKKATSRRSPVPPQRSEEEKEKETKQSEIKSGSEENAKKGSENCDTKKNIETSSVNPNKYTEANSPTKDHKEQATSTNQRQEIDHVSEVSSNGIKAAVPRHYQAPSMTSDPPKERLQLEWIYGYQGNSQTPGNRPQLLASGEMVYFIACTVVLYNREEHRQRHYRQHTATIRCLAVHTAGVIVASGQDSLLENQDTQAHIRVWRCDTLATLHVIGQGLFHISVVALCFMPGQDVLAACDSSQDKQLTIWNTAGGKMIAKAFIMEDLNSVFTFHMKLLCSNTRLDKVPMYNIYTAIKRVIGRRVKSPQTPLVRGLIVVVQLSFNLKYPEVLVSCGKEHLAWWKIYVQTRMIQPLAKPNYEGFLKARYINCIRHNQKGDLISGDSNGTVYVWGDGDNKITNFVKHGHEGSVLDVLQTRGYLLTAGRDGAVKCWTWNKNMDNDGVFQLPDSEGGARSLLLTPPTETSEGALMVGTTINSLLGVALGQTDSPLKGATFDGVPITQGHAGELKAVARIRKSFLGADVVTASGEGTVCKLSSGSREPVWKLWLKGNSFTCVDCCEGGQNLVLGTKEGHVMVLEIDQVTLAVREVYHRKLTSGQVTTARFSPDEEMIAAGTSDKNIHILHLKEREIIGDKKKLESEMEWVYYGILKGHSGEIHSLDWSANRHGEGYIIRSSTTTPEQKFWDITNYDEIDGRNLSDFPWASSSCLLDHKTAGLWSSRQASEGHVICLDVNPDNTIVAMATTTGCLSIFQFPCTADKAFSHAYKSHHSPQNVCFTPDGRSLLTVGGADTSIMQWRIV